jgi:hypothetical protein
LSLTNRFQPGGSGASAGGASAAPATYGLGDSLTGATAASAGLFCAVGRFQDVSFSRLCA